MGIIILGVFLFFIAHAQDGHDSTVFAYHLELLRLADDRPGCASELETQDQRDEH